MRVIGYFIEVQGDPAKQVPVDGFGATEEAALEDAERKAGENMMLWGYDVDTRPNRGPAKRTLTREDIESVYDELDRRMYVDVKDGTIPYSERWIREERASRLQGVYGTLMALVPNRNWQDITTWIHEIEEKRYGERLC